MKHLPNNTEPVLMTDRLELHHVGAQDVVALFETPQSLEYWYDKAFTNPYRVLLDNSGPLHWRVPQVKVNPQVNKWFVRWMVLKETREIVGSMSFHGPPDENGMMEIGLEVVEVFRRRGIATEALIAMWHWVVQFPEVRVLRYTVSPENTASVRLIERLGFMRVGQQIDEIDGPEDIYEMSSEQFTSAFVP